MLVNLETERANWVPNTFPIRKLASEPIESKFFPFS